jgi:hypothetical protein
MPSRVREGPCATLGQRSVLAKGVLKARALAWAHSLCEGDGHLAVEDGDPGLDAVVLELVDQLRVVRDAWRHTDSPTTQHPSAADYQHDLMSTRYYELAPIIIFPTSTSSASMYIIIVVVIIIIIIIIIVIIVMTAASITNTIEKEGHSPSGLTWPVP